MDMGAALYDLLAESNAWDRAISEDNVDLVNAMARIPHVDHDIPNAIRNHAYKCLSGPLRQAAIDAPQLCLVAARTRSMIFFLVRELGIDPNIRTTETYFSGTPIHFSYVEKELIDAIIACGVNVDAKAKNGQTWFAYMCDIEFRFDYELVVWFVEKYNPSLEADNVKKSNIRHRGLVKIYEARVAKCQRAVLCWMYRTGRAAAGPNRDVVRMIGEEIWASRRNRVWS